jgi:hypothetical protein
MCDLFSWLKLDAACSKKHGGVKVLFLTDETVEILKGRKGCRWSKEDVVGHSAIEAFYHDAFGQRHRESRDKIPPVIAEMYRAGKMDKMVEGILGKDRKAWPKYNKHGERVRVPLEDFSTNTKYLCKAIVYYCRNYLVNGEDISALEAGAIKTLQDSPKSGDIDQRLTWGSAPQKFDFWACLFYLIGGDCRGAASEGKVVPRWTAEEMRMISRIKLGTPV